MSGFSADWLALREPADRAARDPSLRDAAAAHLAARGGGVVADLGCGTGSTLRALAPLAPGARWRLIDSDAALLAEAEASARALGAEAETLRLDLARDLDRALAPPVDLVACSALIDLVSADWIAALARRAAEAGAAVYAALSYDGVERWEPPHLEDRAVAAGFLADMRRDKGFGPALGPDGAIRLAGRLEAEGFAVRTARSDWRLRAPERAALIAALAEGVADAASAPSEWLAARRAAATVEIGHLDLFATPPG